MTSSEDFFLDVSKTAAPTSAGDVELPIRYYDASNYLAIFRVQPDRARKKLEGTGLEVLPVGGKAIAVLTFFKYRKTSIGPYHEVGLAVLAVPPAGVRELSSIAALVEILPEVGLPLHVLDLPVSTPLADAAGRELWGYPKFVAEMPIELQGENFSGRVLEEDGRLILALAGKRGHVLAEDQPGADIVTYTMRERQLLRTMIRTRGCYTTSAGGALRLEVGDSLHPMAVNVRDLGLENKAPKILQTTENFQSLLFAGEPVDAR